MQTLFLNMDDILGKGLNLIVIIELIFYLSVKLIPLALTVAVLLASVMVFGNMGEKYELSSFQSAGVPLFRIMRPMIVFVTFVSLFSYLCNDYFNPKASLQLHSRMFDISRQKTYLSIEEKMFNNDFNQFTIWVDKKSVSQRNIENVLIYNKTSNTNDLDVISAREGEMFSDESERYFIMNLNDGVKYSEQLKESNNGKLTHPFIRTEFRSWKKAFDLAEFELGETDRDLFRSHQYMRTTRELNMDIDSINLKIKNIESSWRLNKLHKPPYSKLEYDRYSSSSLVSKIHDDTNDLEESSQVILTSNPHVEEVNPLSNHQNQRTNSSFNFFQMFERIDHYAILSIANNSIKNIKYETDAYILEKRRIATNLAQFKYELHSKFSLSIACLIFLFIGAPMGTIVRRGGFGYPFLISIIVFAIYIICSNAMKSVVTTLSLPAPLAAWIPNIVIFGLGLILTIQATNGSNILVIDKLKESIQKVGTFFRSYN